jgi:hypothetical protein
MMRAHGFALPVRLLVLSILFVSVMVLIGCRSTNETFTTWNQGSGPQWLNSVSTGFCYMTRISGKFTSDKEGVYVGVFPFPNSAKTPFWQVGGTSSTKDVTVTAGCSAFSSFNMTDISVHDPAWIGAEPVYVAGTPAMLTDPDSNCCPAFGPDGQCVLTGRLPTLCQYSGGTNGGWQAGNTVTPLIATNSFCSLNAVRGGFNGGERVTVQPVTSPNLGLFQLQIVAPTPNDTVSAAASCVSFSPANSSNSRLGQIYTWKQGDPPVNMIPGSTGICFLMAVGGKFRGNGEYVEIDHDTANPRSSTPQILAGHSDQKDVWAQAMCVLYQAGGR